MSSILNRLLQETLFRYRLFAAIRCATHQCPLCRCLSLKPARGISSGEVNSRIALSKVLAPGTSQSALTPSPPKEIADPPRRQTEPCTNDRTRLTAATTMSSTDNCSPAFCSLAGVRTGQCSASRMSGSTAEDERVASCWGRKERVRMFYFSLLCFIQHRKMPDEMEHR